MPKTKLETEVKGGRMFIKPTEHSGVDEFATPDSEEKSVTRAISDNTSILQEMSESLMRANATLASIAKKTEGDSSSKPENEHKKDKRTMSMKKEYAPLNGQGFQKTPDFKGEKKPFKTVNENEIEKASEKIDLKDIEQDDEIWGSDEENAELAKLIAEEMGDADAFKKIDKKFKKIHRLQDMKLMREMLQMAIGLSIFGKFRFRLLRFLRKVRAMFKKFLRWGKKFANTLERWLKKAAKKFTQFLGRLIKIMRRAFKKIVKKLAEKLGKIAGKQLTKKFGGTAAKKSVTGLTKKMGPKLLAHPEVFKALKNFMRAGKTAVGIGKVATGVMIQPVVMIMNQVIFGKLFQEDIFNASKDYADEMVEEIDEEIDELVEGYQFKDAEEEAQFRHDAQKALIHKRVKGYYEKQNTFYKLFKEHIATFFGAKADFALPQDVIADPVEWLLQFLFEDKINMELERLAMARLVSKIAMVGVIDEAKAKTTDLELSWASFAQNSGKVYGGHKIEVDRGNKFIEKIKKSEKNYESDGDWGVMREVETLCRKPLKIRTLMRGGRMMMARMMARVARAVCQSIHKKQPHPPDKIISRI